MPDIGPITISHTPFAELDLLLAEDAGDGDTAWWIATAAEGPDELEPETVDAFNTQILAGLVSP
jgi:hypothetical protein